MKMADLITYRQDLLSICRSYEKRGEALGGHVVEHPDTSELLLFLVSRSNGSRIYKVNSIRADNFKWKLGEDHESRTLSPAEFDRPITGFVPHNYEIPWETRHNWQVRRFRHAGKRKARVGTYSMKDLEAQVKSLSRVPPETTVSDQSLMEKPIDYYSMLEDIEQDDRMARASVGYATTAAPLRLQRTLEIEGIKTYKDIMDYFQNPECYRERKGVRIPKISNMAKTLTMVLYRHLRSVGIELFEGGYTPEELNQTAIYNSVGYSDLSVRAANLLSQNEIKTMADLAQKTLTELRRMKGCGKGTVEEFQKLLASEGLSFAEKIPIPQNPRQKPN